MLFWTGLGFVLGALPFSVWLGRLVLRADIRRFGDGNPGAANAWRAGTWRVGVTALLLDYFKGALPVGLAHFTANVSGWGLVPVALAPVAGHAFSPFLGWRGGKALTVTFGIWTGLMLGEAPIMLGLFMALFLFLLTSDAWAVVLGMLGLLAHLLLRGADAVTLVVWAGNMAILMGKHRSLLHGPLEPRPWLLNVLRLGR